MRELFEVLSFRALWTPELIAVLAGVALIYILLTRKWYVHFEGGKKPRPKQDLLFVLGLVALYIGWGSPFYSAGHMSLWIHMMQMVSAYFVAVPLFMLAIPRWFLAAAYQWLGEKVPFLRKAMFHWVVGLITFNALFSFYHLPVMFDFLMINPGLQSIYEILMFVGAWMMWWHMIAPLPSEQYLHDMKRILYVFGNGILITPACALIIFSGGAVYNTYTDMQFWSTVMAVCLPPGSGSIPPSMFGGVGFLSNLDPYHDQQLGGVLMKVAQEIIYGTVMGVVFKQWITKDSHQEGDLSISDIPPHIKMGER